MLRHHPLPRWISLIIVMTGVGLVGYSGSLIKNAISATPLPGLLGIKLEEGSGLIEDPQLENVLIG
jgi:hypothetical protein